MEWIKHVWSFFIRGGVIMWPLLLCSLASLTIILERWSYFRKEDSGRSYPRQFCRLVRQGAWNEVLDLSRKTGGGLAELGVKLLTAPAEARTKESYVAGESQQVINRFEKGLNYLSVIVTLSPILGLLGTITGMMSSFQALEGRWENPLAVTAGVSEAMITTVFGLVIAIATICFHTFFSQKVDILLGEVEQMDNAFLENAGSLPRKGGDAQ